VFLVCCAVTIRSLVMVSNSGDSSASALTPLPSLLCASTKSSLHRLPYNSIQLGWCPCITPWHGPCRKYRFQQFPYCCSWTYCRGNPFVSWSLPSNGSTLYNIILPSMLIFSKWFLSFGFSYQIFLCISLLTVQATWLHIIILHLLIVIIIFKVHKLCTSSLCSFLHDPDP
jgi:fumarate reductase subunit D